MSPLPTGQQQHPVYVELLHGAPGGAVDALELVRLVKHGGCKPATAGPSRPVVCVSHNDMGDFPADTGGCTVLGASDTECGLDPHRMPANIFFSLSSIS